MSYVEKRKKDRKFGQFIKSVKKQIKKMNKGGTINKLKKYDFILDAVEKKGLEISSFCAWDGETLVLNILGKPGAKKDVIGKAKGTQLKVSVTATPVAGKATDHMVKFLAREFGVSTNDITVVFGRFNVNKQLRIKSPKKLPPVVANDLSKLF